MPFDVVMSTSMSSIKKANSLNLMSKFTDACVSGTQVTLSAIMPVLKHIIHDVPIEKNSVPTLMKMLREEL